MNMSEELSSSPIHKLRNVARDGDNSQESLLPPKRVVGEINQTTTACIPPVCVDRSRALGTTVLQVICIRQVNISRVCRVNPPNDARTSSSFDDMLAWRRKDKEYERFY